MNHRQKLFSSEYAASGNATDAALKAGYAKSGAASQGDKLLRNNAITQAVKELQDSKAKVAGLSTQRVIHALWANHEAAFTKGDLAQSNRALELVGRHFGSFAPDGPEQTIVNGEFIHANREQETAQNA